MGNRLELAPDPRHQTQHHDNGRRRPDHVLHEVLHRAAAVSFCEQAPELTLVRGTATLASVVHVGRLVGDDARDRETAGGRFQRQRSA